MTETNENDGRTYAVAQALADNAVAEVLASGAENYLECHFGFTVEGEETERPIVVTIQFADRPSPHELRLVAENQRDRLAELLVQLLRATGADLRDVSLAAGPDLCAVAMDHVARLQAAAQGEREAKPGLFCRECNGRLAVRGVCSIYCPKCEKGDDDVDSSGVPAEALLYRRSDKDDRAWSVTCDLHYMDFFRKADGYESKLLIDAALAHPSPAPELEQYKAILRTLVEEATCADWSGENDESVFHAAQQWCGKYHEAKRQLEAAQARVAELERVLVPFAEVADAYDPAEDDSFQPWKDAPAVDFPRLTLGQHRAAKAALRSAAPVAQAGQVPEVSGIGRDAEHPRAVVLYLRTEPTDDDDLRAIHDGLRSLAAAPAQGGNGKEQGDDPAP